MIDRVKTLVVVLVLVGAGWCRTSNAEQDSHMIVWPGTPAYAQRLESLSISIEQAHALLVSKTRSHPDRFFDRTPIFIIGEEYFFSEPSKIGIPLQGFYLNGTSGTIEYRKSSSVITKDQTRLPEGAFTETQVIE